MFGYLIEKEGYFLEDKINFVSLVVKYVRICCNGWFLMKYRGIVRLIF